MFDSMIAVFFEKMVSAVVVPVAVEAVFVPAAAAAAVEVVVVLE